MSGEVKKPRRTGAWAFSDLSAIRSALAEHKYSQIDYCHLNQHRPLVLLDQYNHYAMINCYVWHMRSVLNKSEFTSRK